MVKSAKNKKKKTQPAKKNIIPIIAIVVAVIIAAVVITVVFINKSKKPKVNIINANLSQTVEINGLDFKVTTYKFSPTTIQDPEYDAGNGYDWIIVNVRLENTTEEAISLKDSSSNTIFPVSLIYGSNRYSDFKDENTLFISSNETIEAGQTITGCYAFKVPESISASIFGEVTKISSKSQNTGFTFEIANSSKNKLIKIAL